MTNLTGYLKKTPSRFSAILLVALYLFFSSIQIPSEASTENTVAGFTQRTSIIYSVNSSGLLSGEILLTVKPEEGAENVVKYFTITLPYQDLENLEVKRGSTKYTISESGSGESTKVIVDVNNLAIDRSNGTTFRITFTLSNYLERGETREIPLKIASTTTENVKLVLNNPYSSFIVPQIKGMVISEQNNQKIINISNPEDSVMSVSGMDEFVYQFSIDKVIVNSDDIDKKYSINIPKIDTGQRVLFTAVSQPPLRVVEDIENNLSLEYRVEADSELTVKIEGLISLDDSAAGNIQFGDFENSTEGTGYWKLSDETELKRIDLYIKNAGIAEEFGRDARTLTAEQNLQLQQILYNYTLDRLGSESDLDLKSTYRQGSKVLDDPATASAEDYNDFLIAVLRAYSVPSRLVQGYVADSSGLFDAGFLHSWVEVWAESEGWRTADPSLQVISGIGMFNPEFKDHIAFVTRSDNPFKPQMGFFVAEEITISLTERNFAEILSTNTTQELKNASLLNPNSQAKFTIENDGNSIVKSVKFTFGDTVSYNSFEKKSDYLIFPGQTVEIGGELRIEDDELKSKKNEAPLRGNLDIESVFGTTRNYVLEDNVTIKHYWWWDTFITLISLFIFLVIALVSVNVIKGLKRIIIKKKK